MKFVAGSFLVYIYTCPAGNKGEKPVLPPALIDTLNIIRGGLGFPDLQKRPETGGLVTVLIPASISRNLQFPYYIVALKSHLIIS
jgi:hypothetical protein